MKIRLLEMAQIELDQAIRQLSIATKNAPDSVMPNAAVCIFVFLNCYKYNVIV
jgi:hypothetical protein